MASYFLDENSRLVMEELIDITGKNNLRLTLKLCCMAVQGVLPDL